MSTGFDKYDHIILNNSDGYVVFHSINMIKACPKPWIPISGTEAGYPILLDK